MNPEGHPQTLEASHPGNASALRHGAYSPRLREPRAQEIAEAMMREPHTQPIDALGAAEIGRLEALIEVIDDAIADLSVKNRSAKVERLVEMRLRASRRLAEWLDRYGATPKGRAEWARQLAEGETYAETLRRKREAAGR